MAGESLPQYEFSDVRKRAWIALQQLYLCDCYLFEHEIHECSVSHRLAVYFENLFPGWRVDCEFNKCGNDPKLASRSVESKRPDIIVHQRGERGPNLLAVEIKKQLGIDSNDREKVRRYIDELKYKWAVCISLQVNKAICEWQGDGVSQQELDELVWAKLEDVGYGER